MKGRGAHSLRRGSLVQPAALERAGGVCVSLVEAKDRLLHRVVPVWDLSAGVEELRTSRQASNPRRRWLLQPSAGGGIVRQLAAAAQRRRSAKGQQLQR